MTSTLNFYVIISIINKLKLVIRLLIFGQWPKISKNISTFLLVFLDTFAKIADNSKLIIKINFANNALKRTNKTYNKKKMTSIFNFYVIIPIINLLLLALNFILAPHKPYKEKKTPFECGYHSFLWQNRTQFTISFFLFGLLFLMFDIEIVIIYPISVSSYFNAAFGISVVVLFVLILALGFVFELGKGALKIDSKQGRVQMRSSLTAVIPVFLCLQIPQQIIWAFKDFYNKVKSFYMVKVVAFSTAIKAFIMLISFMVCSPICLNILSYSDFNKLLSIIIVVFYSYNLYQKSDMFNGCYNLVKLLLNLLFLFTTWTILLVFISETYAFFSNILILTFAESALDLDEDFDNPFTQSITLTFTAISGYLDNGGVLNMEGNTGDNPNTYSDLGGSGNSGNSGGNGGGGGGPGPETIAAGIASGSAAAKQYQGENYEVLDGQHFEKTSISPVNAEKLKDLQQDQGLRSCVHTNLESPEKSKFWPFENSLLKNKNFLRQLLSTGTSDQDMRNIDGRAEADVENARTISQGYRNTILQSQQISPNDKVELVGNLQANFEKSKDLFKDTVKIDASDVAREFNPNYWGYYDKDDIYISRKGEIMPGSSSPSSSSESDDN